MHSKYKFKDPEFLRTKIIDLIKYLSNKMRLRDYICSTSTLGERTQTDLQSFSLHKAKYRPILPLTESCKNYKLIDVDVHHYIISDACQADMRQFYVWNVLIMLTARLIIRFHQLCWRKKGNMYLAHQNFFFPCITSLIHRIWAGIWKQQAKFWICKIVKIVFTDILNHHCHERK